MSFASGMRIGPYEIQSALGAGGMGEVYRARDTRLRRDVAIKILPEIFATDPDRLARFEREAQLLASLNHPNIGSIFGVEEAGPATGSGQATVRALVLELVEGRTLAEMIEGGPLPLDEALLIATQIALALEAAHAKGIIHRDLKPANIKRTADGAVKVLDFGLAKALDPIDPLSAPTDIARTPSQSPTVSSRTHAGVVLGTAPYMAPEQARGKVVDQRADIWAFGCVLYEMLAGRRAFGGEDIPDTLAKILEREPDWSALPASTPPHVHALLRRCLQKDRGRRTHHIADARLALEEPPAPPASIGSGHARRRLSWRVAAAGAIALAAAVVAWRLVPSATPPLVRAFTIPLAGFSSLSQTAISPDGRWLAYVPIGQRAPFRLYVRSVDSFDVREVGTSLSTGLNPFFSPDGRWLAYFSGSDLVKVPVAGGSPQALLNVAGPQDKTGAWGPDGTIVVHSTLIDGAVNRGLVRVSSEGGAVKALTDPADNEAHLNPEILPDGSALLFTVATPQSSSIAGVPMIGGPVRVIMSDARSPRFSPTGHLLFQRPGSGEIAAVPFNPSRLEVTGEPVTLVAGVARVVDSAAFAISHEGTLIYSLVSETAENQRLTIVSVDRTGVVAPVLEQPGSWAQPRMSPDGRVMLYRAIATPRCDLWALDLVRGTRTRVTFDHDNHDPVWHPNGREFTWGAATNGPRSIRIRGLDGAGAVRTLAESPRERRPESWSRDGRHLAFGELSPTTDRDIWILSVASGEARPFVNSRFREEHAAFSPDGRWIAYVSNESGRDEVYAQAYEGIGGRLQISINGGTGPIWSPDGREMFYAEGTRMMAVDFEGGRSPQAGRPHMLFEGPFVWERSGDYDITPDGRRFVIVRRSAGDNATATLRVLVNWPMNNRQP